GAGGAVGGRSAGAAEARADRRSAGRDRAGRERHSPAHSPRAVGAGGHAREPGHPAGGVPRSQVMPGLKAAITAFHDRGEFTEDEYLALKEALAPAARPTS